MSLDPRPHQEPVIKACLEAFRAGKRRIVVHLATGGGKTVIASLTARELDRLCRKHRRRALRVLCLAHRKELLGQMARTLCRAIPDASATIMQGSRKLDAGANIVVASAQTAANDKRIRWLRLWAAGGFRNPHVTEAEVAAAKPDLIIVDECHHYISDNLTWSASLHAFPTSLRLGLSATIQRDDKKGLEDMFDEVVASLPISQGIREGWLCDLRGRIVRIPGLDLSAVKVIKGDFAQSQLAKACNQTGINEAIVEAWTEYARERPTLAFCVTVEHAHELARAFREVGVTAEAVDADTDSGKRDRIVNDFRAGKAQVLANYGIYTEGFDAPSASCALMCRPTKQQSLYIQMIGRITRLAPGKADGLVLDVTGISAKHRPMQLGVLFGGEAARAKASDDDPVYVPTEEERRQQEPPDCYEQDTIESVYKALEGALETTSEFNLLKAQPARAGLKWSSYLSRAGTMTWVLNVGRYGQLVIEQVQFDDGEEAFRISRQLSSGRRHRLHQGELEYEEAFGLAEDLAIRCGAKRPPDGWEMEGDAGDDGGPPERLLIDPDAAWRGDEATEKQRAILRRWKLWRDGMTKGEASQVINAEQARRDSELATPKQVWFLRSKGVVVPDGMTKREAGQLISKYRA